MAIEIVPKEKIKKITKEGLLFYASLGLLVVALLSFAFLFYYEKKSLDTISELNDSLAQQQTQERKELSKRVFLAKEKIESFSVLINDHRKSSNAFSLLEGNTHPEAYFTNFGLTPDKGAMTLQGETENFETLAQQIMIFREDESVKEINLSGTGMGKEGGVSFFFKILLKLGVLKYK